MIRSDLARAAGAVALLTVVSKILGFVREAALAAVFGAGSETDAYLVAQTIPHLLSATASYALTTTLIPVYCAIRRERGTEAASRFATTLTCVVVCVGLVLVVAGEILSTSLVRVVAPGFSGRLSDVTAYLSRIIMPMIVCQLLSGVLTSVLQAAGQFSIPTAASLLQNASIIIATIAFGSRYGIASVAVGALIGSALSTAAMAAALTTTGFRWRGTFDFRDPGLRRMGILVLPAIVGAGVGELNTLVDRILASGLPEGSVSALNYANRLMQLAASIIGASITTVAYPTLAKMAANHDRSSLSEGLADTLGLVHFILAPIAVGIIILREPLVHLVFERGEFDAVATQETAWALLFLSPGIAVFAMRDLVTRAFFALQDTITPTVLGVAAVGVNLALNLILVRPLRQGGLALATTISSLAGLVLGLFAFCRRPAVRFPVRRLLTTVLKAYFSSCVMGVVVWLLHARTLSVMNWHDSFFELASIGIVAALGAVVYLLMAWILRVPELMLVLDVVRRGLSGLRARLTREREVTKESRHHSRDEMHQDPGCQNSESHR